MWVLAHNSLLAWSLILVGSPRRWGDSSQVLGGWTLPALAWETLTGSLESLWIPKGWGPCVPLVSLC